MNTVRKQIIIYISINAVVFTLMLLINSVYPFCWDDKGIAEGFGSASWNIKDIFVHTYHTYYLKWSGKLIPLSIVQIFTLLDKAAYNIINSIMYVVFANTIYRFFWNKKYDCWMLTLIYVSLWFFIPWFGTVVFWLDGTIEYMWMLIPILVFGAIFFKNYFEEEQKKKSILFMFILGFLSGCGLEATGSALIFGLAVMVVAKIIRKIKMEAWEVFGIIGLLIGFAVLMLAPGNYRRAGTIAEKSAIYSNVFYRIARESYFFILYEGLLLGICIALIMLLYKCKRSDLTNKKNIICLIKDVYITCKEPIVLIVLAIISIYVMTFVNAFAVRVFMTPTVLMIIASGITIRRIINTDKGKELVSDNVKVIRTILIFAVMVMLVQMLSAYVFCLYTGEPITKNLQFTNTINDVRLFD